MNTYVAVRHKEYTQSSEKKYQWDYYTQDTKKSFFISQHDWSLIRVLHKYILKSQGKDIKGDLA